MCVLKSHIQGFFNDKARMMKKAFETNPAPSMEHEKFKSAVKTKKTKKRLVDIAEPPAIKSVDELNKEQKKCTQANRVKANISKHRRRNPLNEWSLLISFSRRLQVKHTRLAFLPTRQKAEWLKLLKRCIPFCLT